MFEGNQDIFLRDNLTGIAHNLKTASSTFASEAGSFNTRFDVLDFDTLSVGNPTFDSNSIVLYKKENSVTINSVKAALDHVEIYDRSGRLLAVAKKKPALTKY